MAAMNSPIRILSLGAGVQSSALALMYAANIPRLNGQTVDVAMFADTQNEPAHVYQWLDWLEQQLPFPVIRVTAGNLADYATTIVTSKRGYQYINNGIPIPVLHADGARGIGRRFCTYHFKIVPLQRAALQLAGGRAALRAWRKTDGSQPLVEMLIGISVDEWARAKPSRVPWMRHSHPLLDMDITRAGCLKWMQDMSFPLPNKSACTFCPYHSDAHWADMKENDQESWQSAVRFELDIQTAMAAVQQHNAQRPENQSAERQASLKARLFLHKSLVPLDQVVLKPQQTEGQFGLWDEMAEECEGICGV